jgi:hypothetical protein
MKVWTASDISKGKSLLPIEFHDNHWEWHYFELIVTPERIVFGGCCNVGFIESGYIEREEDETWDETLQELVEDLEVYYNQGSNGHIPHRGLRFGTVCIPQ